MLVISICVRHFIYLEWNETMPLENISSELDDCSFYLKKKIKSFYRVYAFTTMRICEQ